MKKKILIPLMSVILVATAGTTVYASNATQNCQKKEACVTTKTTQDCTKTAQNCTKATQDCTKKERNNCKTKNNCVNKSTKQHHGRNKHCK